MGSLFKISKDTYDQISKNENPISINPNPTNWKIIKHLQIGDVLIVKIQYPDCINYEGNKILVYENTNIKSLKKQTKIDPHFSENKKYKSPLARFEPTDHGWNMAEKFAKSLNEIDELEIDIPNE